MYLLLFVFNFILPRTPAPCRSGARGASGIAVSWGHVGAGSRPRSPPHRVSLALGPQILPQEEDYGFDIEEKNKAVVVKSVQRGSLAEVRLLRGAPGTVRRSSSLVALWAHSGQGRLACRPRGEL